MTDATPLSPAAQAVLNATGTQGTPQEIVARGIATAVLRAAADQLVPLPQKYWPHYKLGIVRSKLFAIAAELEALPNN